MHVQFSTYCLEEQLTSMWFRSCPRVSVQRQAPAEKQRLLRRTTEKPVSGRTGCKCLAFIPRQQRL